MHKLVILVDEFEDPSSFEAGWPQFLHWAEQMPGLIRESTSRVTHNLAGQASFYLIHELFFANSQAAYEAMDSPVGQSAGRTLQSITQGQVSLLFADHREDTIENIRRESEHTAGQETPPDA